MYSPNLKRVQELIIERLVGFQRALPGTLRRFVESQRARCLAEKFRKAYDIPEKIDSFGIGKDEDSITVLPINFRNKSQDAAAILTVSPKKFIEIITGRNIRVVYTLIPGPTEVSGDKTLRIFWLSVDRLSIVTHANFFQNAFFRNVIRPAYQAQVNVSVHRACRIDELIQWLEGQAFIYHSRLYNAPALSILLP